MDCQVCISNTLSVSLTYPICVQWHQSSKNGSKCSFPQMKINLLSSYLYVTKLKNQVEIDLMFYCYWYFSKVFSCPLRLVRSKSTCLEKYLLQTIGQVKRNKIQPFTKIMPEIILYLRTKFWAKSVSDAPSPKFHQKLYCYA